MIQEDLRPSKTVIRRHSAVKALINLDFVFSLAIQMWTFWCVFLIIVLLEHELKADIPLQDFMVSILGHCPGPEVAPDRDTTTTNV